MAYSASRIRMNRSSCLRSLWQTAFCEATAAAVWSYLILSRVWVAFDAAFPVGRTSVQVVAIFFTMIFSSVSQAVDTQVLPFQSNEMYELVKPELRQRSVWYEDLGNNMIKVK